MNNVAKNPAGAVTKVADKVVKDVNNVAKNPAGAAGSVGAKPTPALAPGNAAPSAQSKPSIGATGFSVTNDKVAYMGKPSAVMSSMFAKRGESGHDTEEVASAGNLIEPAQVKGTQIITPATEAEESEGSGLSLTGVQFLTWLILACWLLGTGSAFVWRGRTRVRVARS